MEITDNCQKIYETDGFRRIFSKKPYNVKVWRDWDANRLVKTVNDKIVATMAIPRNWSDRERKDGRKWRVGCVIPCRGFHLTPKVDVVFDDYYCGWFSGKSVVKSF